MDTELTSEQIEKLWQYREAIITSFLQFVNFLLVSESILLAVVGMLSSSKESISNIQIPVISLGILITFLWMYIQGKQKFLLDTIRSKCVAHMPEYSYVVDKKKNSSWKLSNTWLLAYFLPMLFLVTWLLILSAVVK